MTMTMPRGKKTKRQIEAKAIYRDRAVAFGSFYKLRRQAERDIIRGALEAVGWDKATAANALGLTLSGLHMKMQALGGIMPEHDPPIEPPAVRTQGKQVINESRGERRLRGKDVAQRDHGDPAPSTSNNDSPRSPDRSDERTPVRADRTRQGGDRGAGDQS